MLISLLLFQVEQIYLASDEVKKGYIGCVVNSFR